MTKYLQMIAGLIGLAALCACSLVGGKHESLTVYAPKYAAPSATADTPLPWHLVVQQPLAISPLDGARIVVLPQPGVIEFYKGARWRERVPVMLQELLLQAFQDSKRLIGVGTPTSGMHGDYELQMDLRDFQAEYRGASLTPVIAIRMNMQLLEYRSHRVVATHTFSIELPSDGTATGAAVAAFERGLNRVIPEIVQWTFATGETNWTPNP